MYTMPKSAFQFVEWLIYLNFIVPFPVLNNGSNFQSKASVKRPDAKIRYHIIWLHLFSLRNFSVFFINSSCLFFFFPSLLVFTCTAMDSRFGNFLTTAVNVVRFLKPRKQQQNRQRLRWNLNFSCAPFFANRTLNVVAEQWKTPKWFSKHRYVALNDLWFYCKIT